MNARKRAGGASQNAEPLGDGAPVTIEVDVGNKRLAFPGITAHLDAVFSTAGRTGEDDCLEEARNLMAAVLHTLETLRARGGSSAEVLEGCMFMQNVALAMVESIQQARSK